MVSLESEAALAQWAAAVPRVPRVELGGAWSPGLPRTLFFMPGAGVLDP